MGKEMKYADFGSSGTCGASIAGGILDPNGVFCINAVAAGDGSQNRDGRRILMKSIDIQLVLKKKGNGESPWGAGYSDPSNLTVAVILDRQTNAAQCIGTDVFTDVGSGANPYRRLEYENRFRILWFKQFALSAGPVNDSVTATVGNYAVSRRFHRMRIFKKLNIPVTFKTTGGSVSDIVDNSLHIFIMDNANLCDYDYTCRLRFIDI